MTAPYHKAVQETTHVLYAGILTWQQSTGKRKAADQWLVKAEQ